MFTAMARFAVCMAFLFHMGFAIVIEDFELCDVGKELITTNAADLSLNKAKIGEAFRIKWYTQLHNPHFEVSYSGSNFTVGKFELIQYTILFKQNIL